MTQPAFKIDVLRINPGFDVFPRTISTAPDGSLLFTDKLIDAGISLSLLAGLQTMANVLIVGKSGAGAGYVTIQDALDVIPTSSSALNPYWVFVGPGVYYEDVVINRDGVTIQGFGAVVASEVDLDPNGIGLDNTITIVAGGGSIPLGVKLKDLTIRNSHDNLACVRVTGGAASTVGSVGVVLENCRLEPLAVGGNRPIWATSSNYVTMRGGEVSPEDLALMLFSNVVFEFDGVSQLPALDINFDTTGTVGSEPMTGGMIHNCSKIAAFSVVAPAVSLVSNAVFAGSVDFLFCTPGTGVTVQSDGPAALNFTGGGYDLNVTDTPVSLYSGATVTALVSAGTSTVNVGYKSGTVVFAGDLTKTVTFDAPMSDALYTVAVALTAAPATSGDWWITAKTASTFIINFANAQTQTVGWTVQRDM